MSAISEIRKSCDLHYSRSTQIMSGIKKIPRRTIKKIPDGHLKSHTTLPFDSWGLLLDFAENIQMIIHWPFPLYVLCSSVSIKLV